MLMVKRNPIKSPYSLPTIQPSLVSHRRMSLHHHSRYHFLRVEEDPVNIGPQKDLKIVLKLGAAQGIPQKNKLANTSPGREVVVSHYTIFYIHPQETIWNLKKNWERRDSGFRISMFMFQPQKTFGVHIDIHMFKKAFHIKRWEYVDMYRPETQRARFL